MPGIELCGTSVLARIAPRMSPGASEMAAGTMIWKLIIACERPMPSSMLSFIRSTISCTARYSSVEPRPPSSPLRYGWSAVHIALAWPISCWSVPEAMTSRALPHCLCSSDRSALNSS